MDKVIKEMMEKELWELDRKGIKKFKGKRVDEFGRRMFDTIGSYIPPYNRPSVGLIEEIKRLEYKPKSTWHKSQIRKRNQNRKEEIEFGEEC